MTVKDINYLRSCWPGWLAGWLPRKSLFVFKLQLNYTFNLDSFEFQSRFPGENWIVKFVHWTRPHPLHGVQWCVSGGIQYESQGVHCTFTNWETEGQLGTEQFLNVVLIRPYSVCRLSLLNTDLPGHVPRMLVGSSSPSSFSAHTHLGLALALVGPGRDYTRIE